MEALLSPELIDKLLDTPVLLAVIFIVIIFYRIFLKMAELIAALIKNKHTDD